MIKRLYVDNYNTLVNVDLRFDELTLLYGPNGAGKSSILAVLQALRKSRAGHPKNRFYSPNRIASPNVLCARDLLNPRFR